MSAYVTYRIDAIAEDGESRFHFYALAVAITSETQAHALEEAQELWADEHAEVRATAVIVAVTMRREINYKAGRNGRHVQPLRVL